MRTRMRRRRRVQMRMCGCAARLLSSALPQAARVEYHPIGVMGAIVPWNYPFHNVFNPLLANVFAGNALVVKARPSPCTLNPIA